MTILPALISNPDVVFTALMSYLEPDYKMPFEKKLNVMPGWRNCTMIVLRVQRVSPETPYVAITDCWMYQHASLQ